MKKNLFKVIGLFTPLALVCNPAFAVPIAKVTSLFTNISALMTTLGIVVVTIAFMFVGYQVAFGGKRIADMFPVIIGAVVIGAAAQFAAFIIT